ncbi:MAG: PhoX family phosphatase [Gammaproteobacteria bacterium]
MNDHQEDIPSNDSGNRLFEDVLRVNEERRNLLKGGATIMAGTALLGSTSMAEANGLVNRWGNWRRRPLIGFEPVSVAEGQGPEPAISPDYEYQVILPWGDPIVPGGPAFSIPVDPDNQAEQVGIGHDGMWFFPMFNRFRPRWGWEDDEDWGDDDGDGDWSTDEYRNPWLGKRVRGLGNYRGILCMNNEFGSNSHVLRKDVPESLDEVRASQHAHGVTLVELRRRVRRGGAKWEVQKSEYARRVHVNTPVAFSGPVAELDLSNPASPLYNSAQNEPAGTVNNCAMGYTPWGTYLTCEENFNGYFGSDTSFTPDEAQLRYGLNSNGFGYFWHRFDERFDLNSPNYANEHKRFGWVVEIDPMDPDAKPVKRTALGRKKNEGATVHVADDGHIVVYNGDDQRWDYCYKYVSAEPWRKMRRKGESPLDRGTLYVAKFNEDGTGDWLELSMNVPALQARFGDLANMLVNARLAADIVGATPMDRPEWIAVGPDGKVYVTLTNNSQRTNTGVKVTSDSGGRLVDTGPSGPNPIAGPGGNSDGHIVCWTETNGHSGTSFDWEVFQIARDTHGTEESFADPDGIWCDPEGRLFIQTDGGQKDGLQNQMLVADTTSLEADGTPLIKRLFTGVPGCEITGITVTPDRRTMFINIQHPGDGEPATGDAATDIDGGLSSFPGNVGDIPRDATIVITRKDGGVIGS